MFIREGGKRDVRPCGRLSPSKQNIRLGGGLRKFVLFGCFEVAFNRLIHCLFVDLAVELKKQTKKQHVLTLQINADKPLNY